MNKNTQATFWILIILLLVGCNRTQQKAESITCTAAYRTDTSRAIDKEERITFYDSDAEQTIAFADTIFYAAYSTGIADNERNLQIRVTDGNDTTAYYAALYQFPISDGPQNQFVGGHGFTGLNYIYFPHSSAELQFWCAAG